MTSRKYVPFNSIVVPVSVELEYYGLKGYTQLYANIATYSRWAAHRWIPCSLTGHVQLQFQHRFLHCLWHDALGPVQIAQLLSHKYLRLVTRILSVFLFSSLLRCLIMRSLPFAVSPVLLLVLRPDSCGYTKNSVSWWRRIAIAYLILKYSIYLQLSQTTDEFAWDLMTSELLYLLYPP